MVGFIKKEQGEAQPRAEYTPDYKKEETKEETITGSIAEETSTEAKRSFFGKFKFWFVVTIPLLSVRGKSSGRFFIEIILIFSHKSIMSH